MKYLRKFQTEAEYAAFKESDDYVTPNVVLVNGEVIYNPVPPPLYIEALEDLIVKFGNTYEYSKDNVTWTSATSTTSISAVAGERVFFRASGLTANSSSGIGTFTISNGKCNVGGNVMSMVYGASYHNKTEITQDFQFSELFYGCDKIINASELILPATTLKNACYQSMFKSCSYIVSVPKLPATNLTEWCYFSMFSGCTSLSVAPDLPATKLDKWCYMSMFADCTSLVSVSDLPALTIKCGSYEGMFEGCTSLVYAPNIFATQTTSIGDCRAMFKGCTSLVYAPLELPAVITSSAFERMFEDCISLQRAPILPATTLATSCYRQMFRGCTSLVNAPTLSSTVLSNFCYEGMFMGCTSLTTAPDLPAQELRFYCYEYMFDDCTSLVNAPVLPALTLVQNCYDTMFRNCTNLNHIKMLATDISAAGCLNNWVDGVASAGTFIKNSEATWENTFGTSAIPEGWTVEYADA